MTLLWPAEPFPQGFSVDGYQETLPDGRVAVQTDSGMPMARLFSPLAPQLIHAQLDLMSFAYKARLDQFWKLDTNRGINPFWIRDQIFDGQPWTDENYEVITDESGDPILIAAYWLAMFRPDAPPPSYTATAPELLRASFDLIILPTA